ncbi:MAG: ankyrin repeat domain-containing protein [Candidatus Dependentiae bacterium]|nr:ankyrin repeat domain-containing protein [Candidatus Dependentiae bacterium]
MNNIKKMIIATALVVTMSPVGMHAMFDDARQTADRKLFQASIEGTIEDLRAALRLGASINALFTGTEDLLLEGEEEETFIGATPLFMASSRGRTDIVRMLVGAGATIDYANASGHTPLIVACTNDHIDTVGALLRCGANVNAVDPVGGTSLLQACENGNEEMVLMLCQARAHVDVRDSSNRTPLQEACRNGLTESVKRFLFMQVDGLNLFCVDEELTPLMYAVKAENSEIVSMLAFAGADPCILGYQGQTAMGLALDEFKVIMLQKRLAWACRNNNAAVVREMIVRGANPYALDRNNRMVVESASPLLRTVIEQALREAETNIVQELKEQVALAFHMPQLLETAKVDIVSLCSEYALPHTHNPFLNQLLERTQEARQEVVAAIEREQAVSAELALAREQGFGRTCAFEQSASSSSSSNLSVSSNAKRKASTDTDVSRESKVARTEVGAEDNKDEEMETVAGVPAQEGAVELRERARAGFLKRLDKAAKKVT